MPRVDARLCKFHSKMSAQKILAVSALAATSFLLLPKAHAEESAVSANVGLFSDYRFRGHTQTGEDLAVQGGFDFAADNGFYAGNWNSSISWLGDGAGVESDFYVGYATEIGGIGVDVGNVFYYYPGASVANTNEIYLGLSYGPFTFKTSYSTTDYFGVDNSDGNLYYNFAGSFPLSDSLTLDAAVGYHANLDSAEGYDYSIGLSYDLGGGFSLGATFVMTEDDYQAFGPDKNGGFVSISKSF